MSYPAQAEGLGKYDNKQKEEMIILNISVIVLLSSPGKQQRAKDAECGFQPLYLVVGGAFNTLIGKSLMTPTTHTLLFSSVGFLYIVVYNLKPWKKISTKPGFDLYGKGQIQIFTMKRSTSVIAWITIGIFCLS